MGTKEWTAEDLGTMDAEPMEGRSPELVAALAVLDTVTPLEEAERLVREVARRHGIDILELRSACKTREVVNARRDAVRVLRALKLSTVVIGRLLDRDHSSILNLMRPRKQAHRLVAAATPTDPMAIELVRH
jgi:hypothetical protein